MAWVGGVAAVSGLAVPWTHALANGVIVQQPASVDAAWKPILFSREQGLMVARLTEAIIPRTDTAGAIDAKVPEYIDLALSLEPEAARTRFLDGLEAMNQLSRSTQRKPLLKTSDDELRALMGSVSDEHDDHQNDLKPAARLFKDLKARAVFGYYTSLEGRTQELGLPARTQRVVLRGCADDSALDAQ